ncbi:MAG TPA: class I SAM-dependent methyltransferase [Ureibacillus sp.]|nr:class I SAM-dependent methyltransferase [Ureibacillus sp.]
MFDLISTTSILTFTNKKVVIIQNSKYLDFLSKAGIGGAHPGGINLTKEIFKREDINNTSHILDVGCGTGQTAAYLAYKYRANVTGLDIHPTMITKAKKRMKKYNLPVNIIQASVEKVPLPDNHFDYIVSESVLSFVNKQRALKEIYRLLKNGGRFIAIELTITQFLMEKEENEIKQFYGFSSLTSKKDWMALLKQVGFKNIRIRKHTPIESIPDFNEFNNIDPELYEIMEKHYHLFYKYQGILDYRIYSCTK